MAAQAQQRLASGRRVEPLVVPPASRHMATVIFVHVSMFIMRSTANDLALIVCRQGMGQRNEDWVPVLRPVIERHPGVKWILPQA